MYVDEGVDVDTVWYLLDGLWDISRDGCWSVLGSGFTEEVCNKGESSQDSVIWWYQVPYTKQPMAVKTVYHHIWVLGPSARAADVSVEIDASASFLHPAENSMSCIGGSGTPPHVFATRSCTPGCDIDVFQVNLHVACKLSIISCPDALWS